MIDSYIILNRTSKVIMRMFLYIISFLTVLVIWGINSLSYQSYFLFHSQILLNNSYYCFEVLVPVKEVNAITKQRYLLIDDKRYYYQMLKKSNHVFYRDGVNYLKVYLSVSEMDETIQVDGYRTTIRIPKGKKKIIKYFMNKEEVT